MVQRVEFDNRNLHERVYLYLRDKIIQNELKPGSKIQYDVLAEELGVSRTPLRDAVIRLQQDGLIEVKPRNGSFVSIPKVQDIKEIYNIRKALEREALDMAMKQISKKDVEKLLDEAYIAEVGIKKEEFAFFFQADRNFHHYIIEHAYNSRLTSIMNTLDIQIKWFRVLTSKDRSGPLEANEMHKRILLAMYNDESEKAKHLIEEHIEVTKQRMILAYT